MIRFAEIRTQHTITTFLGVRHLPCSFTKIVPTIGPLIVSAKALAGQLFMTR